MLTTMQKTLFAQLHLDASQERSIRDIHMKRFSDRPFTMYLQERLARQIRREARATMFKGQYEDNVFLGYDWHLCRCLVSC